MNLTPLQQLGIQMQKFGGGLQAIALQLDSAHRHLTILFAVVRILKDKDIITDEEIEAKLQSMKEEV
jgi:hypothetical protein